MLADNPGHVPWHVADPYSWSLEKEMERAQQTAQAAEAGSSSQPGGPELPQNLMDYMEQQIPAAHTDNATSADIPKTEPLPPSLRSASARTRKSLTVKSGASFNSPWVFEEKLERLMHDDEIQSSRIFELYKLHAVSSELNEGDTLVFIDHPAPSARSAPSLDCFGTAYGSRQFRVHSEKLLATGSSVFRDMLGPTRQFRTQRRRKVVNKLPEGVKYVLDLTPPSEGDDLVFMMTELSLTAGIRKWWMADNLHGVDSCLVNGHDDVCPCMRVKQGTSDLDRQPTSPPDSSSEKGSVFPSQRYPFKDPPLPQTLVMLREGQMRLRNETPDYREIPDYCPVRHRSGIVRLLMLIEGHNIILDSASRVWTLLGVSKILDCPQVLRDKVVQWMMYSSNARFIEVLPEEALKIGFTLELPDITQCAFRILVNELALDLVASPIARKRNDPGVTIFGRKRGDAGDELNNLIQHAAQAFVDRVESQMKEFEEGFFWKSLKLTEGDRLEELEQALLQSPNARAKSAQIKLEDLIKILHVDFQSALHAISHGPQAHHEAAYHSINRDRASYVAPEDFQYMDDIFNTLNKTQRRLCAFFYHDLMYICEGLLSSHASEFEDQGPGARAGELVAEIRADLEALHKEDPNAVPLNITAVHPIGCERFTAVHLFTLRHQLETAIRPVASWWHRHSIDPPLNITRHLLLTLGPNELKFLPLWAGGNDDGTGGVFEPHVPSTDLGPNGPGPSYHTGITIPSASSVSGSLMEEIRNMNVKGSTTAGSVDVHDSISTVYRPSKVVADDKSIATESVTTSEGGYYAEARYMEPADHQAAGKAVQDLVESVADDASALNGVAPGDESKNTIDDDLEPDDGSDFGSDTLSDNSMVML